MLIFFRIQSCRVQRSFVRSTEKIKSLSQVQFGNRIQKFFGRRDSFVRPTAIGRIRRFHIDSHSQQVTNIIVRYPYIIFDHYNFSLMHSFHRFVEFKYNLGNGAVVLTSVHPINIGVKHKIVAKRYQKDGLLQFENYEPVRSVSMGSLRSLDLNDHAYIGYVPIAHKK